MPLLGNRSNRNSPLRGVLPEGEDGGDQASSLSGALTEAARCQSPIDSNGRLLKDLEEAFASGGPDGPKTVVDACVRVVKDQTESAQSKINMVFVVDMLIGSAGGAQPLRLDAQPNRGHSLAIQVVSQIKVFSALAKLNKGSEKKKTPGFSADASPSEISRFLNAVCEFLDKWGRCFESQDPKSSLFTFQKVRSQLLRDGIPLPSPEAYMFLSSSAADRAAPSSMSVGGGGRLENEAINKLAEEVRRLSRESGPPDMRTADARARFESELQLWQMAAQEAVEREDYAEYDRLSTVVHHHSQVLQDIDSGKFGRRPPSGTGMPQHPGDDGGDSVHSEEKKGADKRQKKSSKDKKGSRRGPQSPEHGWGDPGMAAAGDGATWGAPSPPAGAGAGWPGAYEGGYEGAWDPAMGGAVPPGGGGWQGSPQQDWNPGGSGVGATVPNSMADYSGTPWGDWQGGHDGGSHRPSAGNIGGPVQEGADAVAYQANYTSAPTQEGSEVVASGDVGRAQLEAQVHLLQNNNNTLKASLASLTEQLHNLQRQRAGVADHDLIDARSSLATIKDLNMEHQRELTENRRILTITQEQNNAANVKMAEQEKLLSETRQRHFAEQRRSSQLEEELRRCSAQFAAMQEKLNEERSAHENTKRELLSLKHAFKTTAVLQASGGLEVAAAERARLVRQSVAYGATNGAPKADAEAQLPPSSSSSAPPKVTQGDELAACGASEKPLQALSRQSRKATESGLDTPDGTGTDAVRTAPFFKRTSPEVWSRSVRVQGPPAVLVSRSPPASAECVERACYHFRSLLAQRRGALYEDEHVYIEMAVSGDSSSSGARSCCFEFAVTNRTANTLQSVQIVPAEASAHRHFELRTQAGGQSVRSRQRVCVKGVLEVMSPFEAAPQVDLSYLLPDNLCCRVRLRLPLSIARFMVPCLPSSSRFAELWGSPEFLQAEVTFVCPVRRAFLDAGGHFFYCKCLEMGGLFQSLPGLDESPSGVVLVSSYPQRGDLPAEVLVRTELGEPRGEASACRVTIRSASYMVNRGLAQVFLDVLCDSPMFAAATRSVPLAPQVQSPPSTPLRNMFSGSGRLSALSSGTTASLPPSLLQRAQ